MRQYNPDTDRHVIEKAERNPSNRLIGPSLVDQCRAFANADLEWPVLNPPDGKPTEYANVVSRELCAVIESVRWRVTKDGVPTGTEGTWNDCWLAIHKGSSGASVAWQMQHEGYNIEAV